ncbi:MAG: GspH/FimT family pseudopilin [Pseudomonadota bacterium]
MRGFTVIELMLVVTIASILLAVGAPAFRDIIERTVVDNRARSVVTAINFARSEAIRRNSPVVLCGSSDGDDCDADWSTGWLVFADNNDDADGSAGSVDAGDEVLRRYQPPGSDGTVTFTAGLLRYDGMGFSRDSSATRQFVICPESNEDDNAQAIDISLLGRASRVRDGVTCGT